MGSFLQSYVNAPPPQANEITDAGDAAIVDTGIAPSAQIANGETIVRLLTTDSPFGGGSMTWEDANTVEMIVDYYVATGDDTFLPIAVAYQSFNAIYLCGGNPLEELGVGVLQNNYNDDRLWWALAFIQMYEKLGRNGFFLEKAEAIFQSVCSQWNFDKGSGGGIPWSVGSPYQAAIANALFFQTAVKLYFDDPDDGQEAGAVTKNKLGCAGAVPLTTYSGPLAHDADPDAGLPRQFQNDYLGWALAEYEWFLSGSDPDEALLGSALRDNRPLLDGLSLDDAGSWIATGPPWTYNSGPILGALFDLSNVPASELPDPPDVILQHGWAVGTAAMSYFSRSGDDTLYELSNPTCDGSADCPEFKGVFMRYLARVAYGSVPSKFTVQARAFIEANAGAVWKNGADASVYMDCKTGVTGFGCSQGAGVLLPLDWSGPAVLDGQIYQPQMTSALDALIAAIPTPSPIFGTPPLPPVTWRNSGNPPPY
jgi:hypothetical protein